MDLASAAVESENFRPPRASKPFVTTTIPPGAPQTPYRSEIESLEARKRVLETELQSIDERIKARRKLPLLDQVRVASPCPAKWDEMVGDDRKRFCLSCDKSVFNISSLTREDAEQFLLENAGGDVCVRYYQRADGTIMTSDCSVGVTRKRRKKLALAVAGAGAMAFGAVTALVHYQESQVMGRMEMRPPLPVTRVDPSEGRWVAGGLGMVEAPPAPTPPVKPLPRKEEPRR